MNPATDNQTPPPEADADTHRAGGPAQPSNWGEALMGLVSSRIALIELECKEAARGGARRALSIVAAIICVFFTWALLLAGGIAAIAASTGWVWYWVAIAGAAIHLVAAIIVFNRAKPSGQSAFPVTRSEFQKDREWIENLQKTRKSNV